MKHRIRKVFKILLLLYGVALIASHLTRTGGSFQVPYLDGQSFVQVREMKGTRSLSSTVSMAYLDLAAADPEASVLVLLHGSPVASSFMMPTVDELKGKVRLIVPDLPGFGGSTRKVKDYSILAHAHYLDQLMAHLGIRQFHLAGYSMGGGVAIEYAHAFPDKVESLQLISSIGVQEHELLGDYLINHAIHGAQLAGLWLLQEVVPHFGWMDDAILAVPYARNFYDTDQRPLRGYLEALEHPTLILHAENDNLVPLEAALEHHRIVPQSELRLLEGGHGFILTRPHITAAAIIDFIERTEAGQTPTRSGADPERVRKAEEPFVFNVRPVEGISFVVLWLMLAVATFVSEDLTCISAGLLVTKGVIGYVPAVLACTAGIFVGDVLLYLAGRWLGTGFIRKAPLRWFISESEIIRSSHWFEKRGAVLIFLTRFFPGTRLATYFTCGVLRVPFLKFTGYFILAAFAWTPLLVGLSTILGGQMLAWFETYQTYALPGLIGIVLSMLILIKIVVPSFSHRGRRLLLGKWIRFTRWEFWPLWKFYPPVAAYVLWLGIRHRHLAWFTAANPGMPLSGLVLESKSEILNALREAGPVLPPYRLIPKSLSPKDQYNRVASFLREEGLTYPVVLKPDVGERGTGVAIIRSKDEARDYFSRSEDDIIAQAYVDGKEYGIFYHRLPEEERGHVFSITDKRFISVTGDGERNLERLILDDRRAVALAPFFISKYAERLFEIPPEGEKIRLTELGTHARGSLFLDGGHLKTEALEREIDRISKHFDGFYFGRYDVKAPSEEHLKRGEGISILELNGITSEATSIYDPKNGLFTAYKVLFAQWKIASGIVRQNKSREIKPATHWQVIKQYIDYKNHDKIEV